jgi:uncharacterized protein GlcG (DUF336 family)
MSASAQQNLLADRKVVTSFAARKMAEVCMEFAATRKIDVSLAVVDPAGNLLAFLAAENATETSILTAQLKAKTAARWRRPTAELFDRVNKQINRAPEFVGDFPQGGGFPLFINGELVGAVGAGGGGGGTMDDDCAKLAITTVFGAAAMQARP